MFQSSSSVIASLALTSRVLGASDVESSSSSAATTVENDHQSFSSLGVILVAAFTVLVNVAFFLPAFLTRRRRQRQAAAARRLAANRDPSGHGHNHYQSQDKVLRYGNIESWVMCRTVVAHDAPCGKLVEGTRRLKERRNLTGKKQRAEPAEAVDPEKGGDGGAGECDADDDDQDPKLSSCSTEDSLAESCKGRNAYQECPICFEDLRPGDVASWSLDPTCRHVFHHACIKEWLLQHEGCPFCRCTFLPIDDEALASGSHHGSRSNNGVQQVSLLLSAYNERTRPCYYCAEHGIVHLPPRPPTSELHPKEWQSLLDRGASTIPSREELKQLRASPTTGEEATIVAATESSSLTVDLGSDSTVQVDASEPRLSPLNGIEASSRDADDHHGEPSLDVDDEEDPAPKEANTFETIDLNDDSSSPMLDPDQQPQHTIDETADDQNGVATSPATTTIDGAATQVDGAPATADSTVQTTEADDATSAATTTNEPIDAV